MLFGALILVFVLAIARGEAGAQSAAGRVVIAVIFGVLIAVLARGWIIMVRKPARLEVSQNAVRQACRSRGWRVAD